MMEKISDFSSKCVKFVAANPKTTLVIAIVVIIVIVLLALR